MMHVQNCKLLLINVKTKLHDIVVNPSTEDWSKDT